MQETVSGKVNTQQSDFAKKAFILAVLYMVFHTVMSIFRAEIAMMVPPLMTFIVEDLGIDFALGGTLQTTSTLVMGISICFGSLLIDRFGSSKTLSYGMICFFIAGILGLVAKSYYIMVLARIMTGIGNGFTYPAAVTLVAERFHTQRARGMASSLIQATNSLSNTIVFSITVPVFMMLGKNWNKQMMLWGTCCLVIGVFWLIADRKPDKFFREYNAQLAVAAGQQPPQEETGNSMIKIMKYRKTWSAVICFTGATWLFMTFNTYLPTILKTVHGMTPQAASEVTGLISTAGIVSCIICGLFLGKVKNFKPLYLILMIALPLGGAFAMMLQPGFLMKLCVIVIGVAWGCFVPVCNLSIMTHPGITPKMYAAGNAVWTLLGNVLSMAMPFVFNALQLKMGMQNAALCLCLAGIVTVAGALIYPSDKKRLAAEDR